MIIIQCNNLNLDQIAESGQCFRWFKINDNVPRYNIIAFGKVLEIFQINNCLYFDCSEKDFYNIWLHYFDLDQHYNITIDSDDKFLIAAYRYGSGIRILKQDLWESIVSFIISQRKSIPAIKTSIERLCKAYGDKIEGTEYYAFPTPHQLIYLDQDNCGLGYRIDYIKALAQRIVTGEISLEQIKDADYETAKKILLSIRGIGEKVSNCILLFGLGYMNACPRDVWINRIIDEEYNGLAPEWMNSEYAGLLQQWVFYYKRAQKKALINTRL